MTFCVAYIALSVPRWGVLDTTFCDRVCQWLATGRWVSPGTLVSSTNKTDRHDITEISLKVASNTITITLLPITQSERPLSFHSDINPPIFAFLIQNFENFLFKNFAYPCRKALLEPVSTRTTISNRGNKQMAAAFTLPFVF
jgi:hypothetical protein